jgi:hypothetical protein
VSNNRGVLQITFSRKGAKLLNDSKIGDQVVVLYVQYVTDNSHKFLRETYVKSCCRFIFSPCKYFIQYFLCHANLFISETQYVAITLSAGAL